MLILLSTVFVVNAQQMPRSTLNKYQQMSYNPSETGISKLMTVQTVVRNQFMRFADNSGPSTSWFNISAPLNSLHSGVGITASKTTEGFENRTVIKGNYAYFIPVSSGTIGLGISAGYNSIGWKIENPIYPEGTSDAFIDAQIASKEKFDNLLVGFGAYYKSPNAYASFAITELNNPKLNTDTESLDYFKRTYFLGAGYEYKLSNPMWVIKPSMLIKSTISSTQVNFDAIVEYNNFIIAGIIYNTSNDISSVLGVQFNDGSKFDGLKAIFSMDHVTSKLVAQTSGSMEFMLSYSFALSVEKENKTYKSVRFL